MTATQAPARQAISAVAPAASATPDAPTPPLLELRGVTKVYGSGTAAMRALDGVDLGIQAGEFVAIMGPSGSGKSTAMNIMGCLDTPTTGSYQFRGVQVESLTRDQRALLRRHYLGFVFQGFNLLKRTSALENVELPLIYRGIPRAERHAQAARRWSGGPRGLGAPHPRRTLRRPATTGRHRPRHRHRARRAAGRRTHRQPGLGAQPRDHGPADRPQPRRGITVLMVTHEAEMAAYARRIVHFLDGVVVADSPAGPS